MWLYQPLLPAITSHKYWVVPKTKITSHKCGAPPGFPCSSSPLSRCVPGSSWLAPPPGECWDWNRYRLIIWRDSSWKSSNLWITKSHHLMMLMIKVGKSYNLIIKLVDDIIFVLQNHQNHQILWIITITRSYKVASSNFHTWTSNHFCGAWRSCKPLACLMAWSATSLAWHHPIFCTKKVGKFTGKMACWWFLMETIGMFLMFHGKIFRKNAGKWRCFVMFDGEIFRKMRMQLFADWR